MGQALYGGINAELDNSDAEFYHYGLRLVSTVEKRAGRRASLAMTLLREIQAILLLIGIKRSHQAIWNWVYRLADSVSDLSTAKPSRVAIDETAVRINGDWSWMYAAIDIDSRLILDVPVFGRRGTDLAAAFLHRLTEKYDLSDTVFLVMATAI